MNPGQDISPFGEDDHEGAVDSLNFADWEDPWHDRAAQRRRAAKQAKQLYRELPGDLRMAPGTDHGARLFQSMFDEFADRAAPGCEHNVGVRASLPGDREQPLFGVAWSGLTFCVDCQPANIRTPPLSEPWLCCRCWETVESLHPLAAAGGPLVLTFALCDFCYWLAFSLERPHVQPAPKPRHWTSTTQLVQAIRDMPPEHLDEVRRLRRDELGHRIDDGRLRRRSMAEQAAFWAKVEELWQLAPSAETVHDALITLGVDFWSYMLGTST